MASLDYRLNPLFSIKECSSCGALYTRNCGCSKGSLEDKILVPVPDSSQQPPQNCATCGDPVDGLYCRPCAFVRKCLNEGWYTIHDENEILNTSESSNDNTNIVSAPQEPFVFNQDPGENSSQSPPHIDHNCCYECGDSLDGIFCQQCTCKSCGKGAHYGYNCPPQIPIISNPEPCYNQNLNEILQNLQSLQQQCLSGTCQQCGCNEYDGVCFYCTVGNGTPINFSTPYSSNDSPSFANHPPQPQYVPYSCELCGNDSHYGYDWIVYLKSHLSTIRTRVPIKTLIIFHKLHRVFHNNILVVKIKEEDRRITEDQAAKDRYWKIPICYDDDEDYTIAITPVLSTEEPVDSLIMEDEHLDTIPAMELDKVIKSSVENLVPIPSESEGIPDSVCDVPLYNNPTPLEAFKDYSKIVVDSNDYSSSSDDDSFFSKDIEYVDASPPDAETVSSEVVEIVIPEVGGIDTDILLTIKDDIIREKLLNVNLLIANIEALKDNPTPSSSFVTKSPSTFPNSFLEETNTFDNSLPESETFCFNLEEISSGSTTTRSDLSLPDYEAFYLNDDHIEEKSSGSTTTHADFSQYDSFIFDLSINLFPPADRSDFYHEEFADELAHIISPPEYDCFYFKNEPELGDFTMDVVGDIFPTREPRVHVPNVLPTHPTLNLDLDFILSSDSLFAYIVWIFLPFLTYPVSPPYLLSTGNEDTIFDPGISIYHSFMPGVSHRSGTFMKFNDCSDFEASRARGFCPSFTRASNPQLHLGNPIS
ncbi:hypothetical protein Tco_1220777 [Tanacetum coccineum]